MTDPPPSPPRGGAYIAMSYELPTVILNLVQDLTEDWENKARSEMLKQVQHDVKKR